MNNVSGIEQIMDYLLAWTVSKCSPNAEHICSAEVYDRAISVIGIIVPVSLWLLVLFCFALCVCAFYRLFLPGKK